MKSPQKMQQFVINGVPLNELQGVKDSLKNDGCTNIKDKPETGGSFTVTALCPMRPPDMTQTQ
jgi:hypothetical protein